MNLKIGEKIIKGLKGEDEGSRKKVKKVREIKHH